MEKKKEKNGTALTFSFAFIFFCFFKEAWEMDHYTIAWCKKEVMRH